VARGNDGRSQGPLRREPCITSTGTRTVVAKLVQHGTLKTYHGFPHGMPTTQADTINADLLAWLRS
jgi:hypothetical protein